MVSFANHAVPAVVPHTYCRSPIAPCAYTALDGYGLTCAFPATFTPLPGARIVRVPAVVPLMTCSMMFCRSVVWIDPAAM